MKKVMLAFLLPATAFCAFAQLSLDTAIQTASDEIGARLERNTTIAVASFGSSSNNLSNYVIEELNNALLNNGRLRVVTRDPAKLASIRREFDFSDSDMVSNRSAQQIGRGLGAQTIVNGSLTVVAGGYRMTIQVMEVETLTLKYSKNIDIKEDQRLKSLMTNSNVVDFTFNERAGAAGLNLALGLGSFLLQKDTKGGTITAVVEGLGLVLFIAGAAGYSSEQGYEDSPQKVEDSYYSYFYIGGLLWYGAGAVYGIARAFTYTKPGYVADIPLKINLVSDRQGNTGLRLSYSLKF